MNNMMDKTSIDTVVRKVLAHAHNYENLLYHMMGLAMRIGYVDW